MYLHVFSQEFTQAEYLSPEKSLHKLEQFLKNHEDKAIINHITLMKAKHQIENLDSHGNLSSFGFQDAKTHIAAMISNINIVVRIFCV